MLEACLLEMRGYHGLGVLASQLSWKPLTA